MAFNVLGCTFIELVYNYNLFAYYRVSARLVVAIAVAHVSVLAKYYNLCE